MFLGAMYYKLQSHTALEHGGHLQDLSKESFVSDIYDWEEKLQNTTLVNSV